MTLRFWTIPVEGALLRAHEHPATSPDAPTVLLVHGYPDDQRLFDPMIAELDGAVRVITYDTRGGNESLVTDERRRSFRLSVLADDLLAVAGSIPDLTGPVHLFAHDFGSVQAWEALRRPEAVRVFASYTSVAGPSLDHLRLWTRRRWWRPTAWPQITEQLLRSWYVFGFYVPGLTRLTVAAYLWCARHDLRGIDLGAAPLRGTRLYRASLLQRQGRGPAPACAVPTTVVIPSRDRYLTRIEDGLDAWIGDLRILEVDGEHWWPRSEAAAAAALLLSTARSSAMAT